MQVTKPARWEEKKSIRTIEILSKSKACVEKTLREPSILKDLYEGNVDRTNEMPKRVKGMPERTIFETLCEDNAIKTIDIPKLK